MATRTWTGAVSGDWGNSGNWAEAAVPASGDDVAFAGTAAAVTAGLNQSAVTLASLTIDPSFTGQIGTSIAYLRVGCSVTTFTAPASSATSLAGASRVKLDYGSSTNTTNVAATASASADVSRGLPAVQLLGSNLTLNLTGGSVAVAASAGESATLTAARVGRGSGGGGGSDPSLLIGSGCTVSDLHLSAGVVVSRSAQTCPSARLDGGVYDFRGTGAHTLLDVNRGTAYYSGTGTITAANVAGTLDFSRDVRPRTVTDCSLYRGGGLNADNGNPQSITFTNAIKLQHCGVEDVATLKLGSHIALTIASA